MELDNHIGESFKGVKLETCRDQSVTRPRVRTVENFDVDTRVEFPRKLRELFPIGTQYLATVKVCQKHNKDGSKKGQPYLRASDIALIPESVPDKGLVAKVQEGSISGLAYKYVWDETF